jgi:hypothetical protein
VAGQNPATIFIQIKIKRMTVKQLIEHLQQLPQDKKVILSHDDHTDWNYATELLPELIVEDYYYDDEDENSDEEEVVIIDCKFW